MDAPEELLIDQALAGDLPASVTQILPTMNDLDRLAGDLDRIDLTLVELDAPNHQSPARPSPAR